MEQHKTRYAYDGADNCTGVKSASGHNRVLLYWKAWETQVYPLKPAQPATPQIFQSAPFKFDPFQKKRNS